MAEHSPKTYVAPKVKRYGPVEEITQAIIWPGSGDIMSQIVEEATGRDVQDGCPRFAPGLCTGS